MSSATPNLVTLDVCEDIRQGRQPFTKIMKVVEALREDEQLLVIAPFRPVPLFHVMEARGYRHSAKPTVSGNWNVLFTRDLNGMTPGQRPVPSESPVQSNAAVAPGGVIDVDARGLEPPQPIIKILEALGTLGGQASLRARTDRRPMHLYPELEARGFVAETEEQSDGSFLTQIRRR